MKPFALLTTLLLLLAGCTGLPKGIEPVTGFDQDRYLWLMSRTPEVSEEVLETFMERAEAEGFELGELIVVEQ